MHFVDEHSTFFFLRLALRLISAPVLGTLPNFEKIPVLGFPVLEDFEKFQKSPCAGDFSPVCALCCWTLKNSKKFPKGISPLCGLFGLWCVETLKIFTIPLCVGPVLCGDFENFQNYPVCGPCAVWRL